MQTVDALKAKAHLSALLERSRKGEEVIITNTSSLHKALISTL